MRKRLALIVGMVTALLLAAGLGTADADRGNGASGTHVQVRQPDARLTTQWWQDFMALTGGAGALDRCDVGTRNVVFLAGTAAGDTVARSCTIPANKSILVPLINVECSEAEDNGSTFRELKACTSGFVSDFTDLILIVDGVRVRHLTEFRVQSRLFRFTAVEGNPFGIDPALRTPSVSDGYWAQIGPFREGTHLVSFGGSYPPGPFSTRSDYTLTIQSR